MWVRHLAAVSVALGLPGLAASLALGAAPGPMDTVRRGTDKILGVLQDEPLKAPERVEERRKKIEAVVDEYFNWPAMARSSLGIHWRNRTDPERDVFVALYRELVRNTYMGKVEGYAGEKVLHDEERVEGDYARVHVRILTTKSQEIPVVYSMKRSDGRWLVYDIAVEGVRLVNNYRTQFSSMLNSMSYEEFVKKLQDKVKSLDKEE